MNCLTEDQVLAFLAPDGTVERAAIEHHLDSCAECMELVTLASQTSLAVHAEGSTGFTPGGPSRELAAGTQVGRYEILEPRGRGAMGTVYAARDPQLDRQVAIKLVDSDNRAQVALLREAKALARVTHPNVLTVYDFGTFEQHVFLAAELVEGDSLAVWSARPRSWRAVVAVYLDAARGLVAAHAAGLVHRDFKPANVLIGTDHRVRVCDFGLVRFTDTRSSARELVGTPVYMAPEQRRGEVADARSDQYAFAIALHEALYGHLPDRPPPAHKPHVPRWLGAIVTRGRAAAPDDRFPSMTAVVAALEHGLRRRTRWTIGALAGGAAAVAAATMIVGYRHGARELDARCPEPSLGTIWDAAAHARLDQTFAATKLPYAQVVSTRTARSLDAFATHLRAQHREACLAFEVHHTDDRALHDRRTSCLEQSQYMFEAIVNQLAQPRHDRLLVETGNVLGSLPDLDACIHPRESGAIISTDRAASSAFFAELARVQVLATAGRMDEAARELVPLAKTADVLDSKRARARVKHIEGQIATVRGQPKDAATAFEAALWAAEAAGYDELVATAASDLVHVLGMLGRDADVQRFRELALAAGERVGSTSARASVARAIGQTDLVAGRFESAEKLLTRALELEESRTPPDNYNVGAALMDLGDLYYRRGQLAKAEPVERRAIDLLARELGPAHPTHGSALNNLANTVADLGRFDEARELYARALAVREAALGPDHPEVAQTLNNAAGVAVQAGKLDDARRDLERALAIYHKHADASPIAIASALHNLGEIATLQARYDDARTLHEQALELRKKTVGDHHPVVVESELALAGLALLRKDVTGARTWCDAARASSAGSDAGNASQLAALDTCSGQVELASNHAALAIPLLERALAHQTGADADPGEKAVTQFALARALPASPRAIELAHTARTAFEHDGAMRTRDLGEVDAWLAAHAK